MLVSDLSSLALELAVWGVKDPATLSWLDPPPAAAWAAAKGLLRELGALDPHGAVTRTGKSLVRLPLHPRLGRLLLRAAELGFPLLGADLAALLSERDILRREPSSLAARDPDFDVGARLDMLRRWQKGEELPGKADSWALRAVDRTSRQVQRLLPERFPSPDREPAGLIPRLLLRAFPDRVAKRREEGGNRFILSQGRGMRVSSLQGLDRNPFMIAVQVDAGEKAEGVVHLAEPVRGGPSSPGAG